MKQVVVLISQIVKDYDRWKALFDSRSLLRKEHEITVTCIARSVANPEQVIVVARAPSAERAQSYFNNPDLVEVFSQTLGAPRIEIALPSETIA